MKFAHLADAHIGGWREIKLREAGLNAFCEALRLCAAEKVDFVLFSGDLFNTPMPPMDQLRVVVAKLRELAMLGIPFYCIAGSHDFSPSGKTMLDVLESAGLLLNVAKGDEFDGKLRLRFVTDPKTGVNITGLLGKKAGLEKEFYQLLDYGYLQSYPGHKIFLFHSAITEMKPGDMKQMDSLPCSLLPAGFDYYAGGHVHVVDHTDLESRRNVVFPGPLFPNSFSELEKLRNGGFYIVEDWKPRYVPIKMHPVHPIRIDCHLKTPAQITAEFASHFSSVDLNLGIATLTYEGTVEGRIAEIPFRQLENQLIEKGAYLVLRNTTRLVSPEFQSVSVQTGTLDEIEALVINSNTGKSGLPVDTERELVKELMKVLAIDKSEGETQSAFERRIIENSGF